jgi:hypothetical protein
MQTPTRRQRRSSSWCWEEAALKDAATGIFVVHACMLADAGKGRVALPSAYSEMLLAALVSKWNANAAREASTQTKAANRFRSAAAAVLR